jgi:serum/glucocorticoid-regulated kinase 2
MQVRKRDTSRIYALKTIRKMHIVNRNEITHTLAERLVLAQVNNPFIVPLKFSFQSEQKLYLVLASVTLLPIPLLLNLMISQLCQWRRAFSPFAA